MKLQRSAKNEYCHGSGIAQVSQNVASCFGASAVACGSRRQLALVSRDRNNASSCVYSRNEQHPVDVTIDNFHYFATSKRLIHVVVVSCGLTKRRPPVSFLSIPCIKCVID